LRPGADDQAVVFHHAAAIEDDGVVLGLEGGDGGLDPVHARGIRLPMVLAVVAASKMPPPTMVQPGW
jgi:hypothetical protein